ncbi:C-type lectin domain family 2 member D-like [Alligator sinensis]|uniref:C-type lectin domain family 2 member D-like n=1 Tax=Alligator sinensis TaxID=38654 RepID=A0A1U7SNT7_ALLSI|nr:C-type lectin domain family 2 member D-like [Alligator sinensis]
MPPYCDLMPSAVEKKRENGSCAKAEPTYFQEDSQKGKGQTHVTIPWQGGERSTKSPQGCPATVSPWMYCLLILSVALNLCLAIPLIARSAKRPEQHPAAPAIPVLSCPAGWIEYLGRCYYFSEAKGSWDSSQSNCSSLGASLARIDNEKEMAFLMRYKGRSASWIGLRRDSGQPWQWADGTNFTHWFPILGQGLCAYMNGNNLASSSCTKQGLWLCSRPAKEPKCKASD